MERKLKDPLESIVLLCGSGCGTRLYGKVYRASSSVVDVFSKEGHQMLALEDNILALRMTGENRVPWWKRLRGDAQLSVFVAGDVAISELRRLLDAFDNKKQLDTQT